MLVEISAEDLDPKKSNELSDVGRDIAMQITASIPKSISDEDLDPVFLASELAYGESHTKNMEADEKTSYLRKYRERIFKENCLIYQPFIKDPEITINEYIEIKSKELNSRISIVRFQRYRANET